mgnify:CR=1 FL=1
MVSFGGNNAGDLFSNPALHFDFSAFQPVNMSVGELHQCYRRNALPSGDFIIIGGGGFLDVSRGRGQLLAKLARHNELVLWGVGTNRPDKNNVSRRLNFDEKLVRYDGLRHCRIAGLRDFQPVRRAIPEARVRYVPCASAMMQDFDQKTTARRSVGLINHAFLRENWPYDLPETIDQVSMDLDRFSVHEIVEFIAQTEVVLTESYHAAYWAQLLGKKVVVNRPVSSKFRSLEYQLAFAGNSLQADLENAPAAPSPKFRENARQRSQSFHSEVVSAITNWSDQLKR